MDIFVIIFSSEDYSSHYIVLLYYIQELIFSIFLSLHFLVDQRIFGIGGGKRFIVIGEKMTAMKSQTAMGVSKRSCSSLQAKIFQGVRHVLAVLRRRTNYYRDLQRKGEVEGDEEGLNTMKALGENIGLLLKKLE